ncbi:Mce protein [Mycobacterium shimoidei]|uniref:Mce protein n=1 Tax=Mycobacterium shimoidei TaxID=29313 RepID=UPI00111C269B|nr:Mce protein [Mycobacterium shimoidei]MCV7258696.1 Mce protein [Mycobacterium shimoidei]
MAEHADTAEQLEPHRDAHPAVSNTRALITFGLAAVTALAGLTGWLGYRVHQDRDAQARRDLYVQVARQAAINLTTIDYTEVDSDIKRILDSATGTFHDDFQHRSQPFVDVVKQVKSKSEGSVSEAALVSDTKDQAQVIVAVSVKTTTVAAAPEQEPRRWRLRITVERTEGSGNSENSSDSAKVSNVEFVP